MFPDCFLYCFPVCFSFFFVSAGTLVAETTEKANQTQALGFLGVLLVARPGSSHETEEETPSGTARGIVVLIGMDIPELPSFDMGTLLTVLGGMLGIGGLRTYEKQKGLTK